MNLWFHTCRLTNILSTWLAIGFGLSTAVVTGAVITLKWWGILP